MNSFEEVNEAIKKEFSLYYANNNLYSNLFIDYHDILMNNINIRFVFTENVGNEEECYENLIVLTINK